MPTWSLDTYNRVYENALSPAADVCGSQGDIIEAGRNISEIMSSVRLKPEELFIENLAGNISQATMQYIPKERALELLRKASGENFSYDVGQVARVAASKER